MSELDPSITHRVTLPARELHFPQKLNLHLSLRGSLRNLAYKVNEFITKAGASEIRFSAASFLWPHVTLNLGWADSQSQLDELMSRLSQLSAKTNPLKLFATKLYAVEPKRSWVFVDVEPANSIISLKRELEAKVRDVLRPVEWDVINQSPHITVGYVKGSLTASLPSLEFFGENTSSTVDSFGISFCGARGTCVGKIQEYDLSG